MRERPAAGAEPPARTSPRSSAASRPTAAQLICSQLAFRNDPANVPAPACRAQGPTPGYGTDFPHVVAEPPGANAASASAAASTADASP